MGEMIERVARALAYDEYDRGTLSGIEIEACVDEDMKSSRGVQLRRMARRAIEVMREPPVSLINAAYAEPTAGHLLWYDALLEAALR